MIMPEWSDRTDTPERDNGFGWRDKPGGDALWRAILEAFARAAEGDDA